MTLFIIASFLLHFKIINKYQINLSMPKTQQILQPQQPTHLEISFHKQNNHLAVQQNRLNVEILRVHTIEKLRMIQTIFDMSQTALCEFFTTYELFPYHQNHMNIHSLLESQNLKLIKNQDKIYFGQVERKKRNGNGVNISKDGRVYEGQFSNNQKFGHGVQIYANGNLYIGEFQNGKKHGNGQFFWFNLSSKNPKQDEFVEYYDGQWWGGLPDGSGVHQKINGDLYTGNFKNGLKHGQGSQYFGTQQTYKGEYINGLPEGYGEYKWKDGSYYKGDFKQGLRNGYGVWGINENSTQMYKGHYCMDKKSGYGVYQWQNGWVYKGNFQNDLRNGFGQLLQGNKCVYRGYWRNGEQTDQEGNGNSGNVLLDNSMSKTFTKTSSQIYNRKPGSSQKLVRYESNGMGYNPEQRMERQRRNQSASKRKAQLLEHEGNDIWPVSYKDEMTLRRRPQSLTSSVRGSQVKRPSTTQRKTYQPQQNRPTNNNFQFSPNNVRQNRTNFAHRQSASRTISTHGFNNNHNSNIGSAISRPIMRTSNMGNLYVPVRKFETIKRGSEMKYC